MEKFQAEVRKYRPVNTKIDLFYCTAQQVRKRCQESFWGVDQKEFSEKFIKVTFSQCSMAIRDKLTPYGKLVMTAPDQWHSVNEKKYKCAWLREVTQSYVKFTVRKYQGQLVGEDSIIHQYLTMTECRVKQMFCIPKEQPKSVLIWRKTRHDRRLYKSLGIFEVNKISDFYLIAQLGIGGSSIKDMGKWVLLDNTYILAKIEGTSPNTNISETFSNFSKTYATNTQNSVQRELMEGRIVKKLLITQNKTIR